MADSLFDNRYRYDYIYPRGRSGETLRAIDTENDELPVVIKRPAPNDAPPIRAGQEVSIVNEREALSRLAGHAVLTALIGTGQFFVGGMPHQYIVMERAEGMIVADEVARLAGQNERLPELEMLVIVDKVLDLLIQAHNKDIVYNDVDAKHLFWNRENYTLKLIDWGNAIFLEGDDSTPQGVSRQTDVYQVGELLYFILSGGRRADVPRDADEAFKLNFYENDERVHSRLQDIISKAVHPNTRLRYGSISALRNDLSHYRAPLERERNSIVGRVADKLRQSTLSKNDLLSLQAQIEPALAKDPGYPAAGSTHAEVINRLRDLQVSADLDAVRIYMENANWSRAADLLSELRERAGTQTSGVVRLLLDICIQLMDSPIQPMPRAILDAVSLIFDGNPDKAANILLVNNPSDDSARMAQWRIAERISSHFPDVLLLRPNLYRLDNAVRQLASDGIPVSEPRAILTQINNALDETARMESILTPRLRDKYREVVDSITALNAILQTLSVQHEFSERRLPLGALTRALNAAMALADNIHVIGKQAAASPRDALTAVDASRAIDPANPVWDKIEDFLSHLYEILQSCQTYVPSADGSDLEAWLTTKQAELSPFANQLFDELLAEMIEGINFADKAWARYREIVILGDKSTAVTVLNDASEAVETISPTLSGWFNQLRSVVNGANYIERHSVPGILGRTIADGWSAFDKGQLSEAEQLGHQAVEIARSENERFASERLRRLARILREWAERNGIHSSSRSQQALADVEKLFTQDEKTTLDAFSAQMPSNETYLKAMGQGLVRVFSLNSTAALRILFVQYTLLGALDAHDGRLSDAEFWRTAAVRGLGDLGDRHVAIRALDDFIARRRDLMDASNTFTMMNGKHAIAIIDETRRKLENNPQARLLSAGVQSLRDLESALRDWADAEFRTAGNKLEAAIKSLNECEQSADITLTNYRAWLMELQAAVVELSVQKRTMMQIIDRRLDDPDQHLREMIHLQAEVTEDLLGEDYAATLVNWRDTYEKFLDLYTDNKIRRSRKLEQLNELFKAMFIDRHPAYPLYRHWYDVVDSSAEFPAPDPSAPPPQVTDEEPEEDEIIAQKHWLDPEETGTGGRSRLLLMAGIGGIIVIVILGLLALASGNGGDGNTVNIAGVDVTITETFSAEEIAEMTALAVTASPTEIPTLSETQIMQTMILMVSPSATTDTRDFDTPTPLPTSTIANLATHTPTDTGTPTPSDTPTLTYTPSQTYTPTITLTPSNTPTLTPTPTATLPVDGLRGSQNLLDLYRDHQTTPFWNENLFIIQDESWRLGVGTETEGETIYFFPPRNILNQTFGNDAASRITRVEADLLLRTFNPAVVSNEEVYFGLLFQSVSDGNNAGVQIQAVQPTVINLGQIVNNEVDFISQRSVNAVIARLRLDRDPVTGAVTAFFNDATVGAPIDFLPPDAPVVPVIFVKDGGVIIGVTSWRITLR